MCVVQVAVPPEMLRIVLRSVERLAMLALL